MMTASRNALNRRRWEISQQKQARAKMSVDFPAHDADRDIEKLQSLRNLAGMLDGKPGMESTLRAVSAEIARLEAHYGKMGD